MYIGHIIFLIYPIYIVITVAIDASNILIFK